MNINQYKFKSRHLVSWFQSSDTKCVFFEKLVPEDTPWFIHTLEGPDDMPSHIRMALTRTSEVIPILQGEMALGTWQGVFLFEHRRAPHHRQIVAMVSGV